MIGYLRRLLTWLGDPSPVWVFLVGIPVATIVALLPAENRVEQTRIAGVILQMLGVLSVARGLNELRGHFDRPKWLEQLRDWFQRRPRIRAKGENIVAVGKGTLKLSAEGRAQVWRSAGDNASLEQRVKVLEENLETIRKEVGYVSGDLRKRIEANTEGLAKERQDRAEVDRETRDLLEKVGIGGLNLEAVGVGWILLGTILAGLPSEIVAIGVAFGF